MSKDLIERLRIVGGVGDEAADTIERLERELEAERCLSFRNQVAELEQQLYAEKLRCDEYLEDNKRLAKQNVMLREVIKNVATGTDALWMNGLAQAALAATADLEVSDNEPS